MLQYVVFVVCHITLYYDIGGAVPPAKPVGGRRTEREREHQFVTLVYYTVVYKNLCMV